MTLNLTRSDAAVPAPEWLGSDATPVVTERPAHQGQRPRQPTEAERAAAVEVLRKRARLGQYLGPLPVSEAETAAESSRRETLRKDAALIKSTARPASFPFVRNAGNLLAAWAWTDR
jgi:hypothetical protein